MNEATEKVLELLSDIERSSRGILLHEFGIPRQAIHLQLLISPPGLIVQIKQDNLPLPLQHVPGAIQEIMMQYCKSLRAILDRSLPSLSRSLGMRYLPDQMKIEIGVGPDANPIYPHIITASVKELRITEAGKLAIEKGELEL